MTLYAKAAEIIGCTEAHIQAVFEVEAAGRFLDRTGMPIRRFEPHHFPREHWAAIGFDPGSKPPWRASLALSTSRRKALFVKAAEIDAEAAARASSWGAPQMMGFNHEVCGYETAQAMVYAFQSEASQIEAFARFVVGQGLDDNIRAGDFLGFAAGYNGPGKAEDYAGKMEDAYRRATGQGSRPVLRLGSKGEAVFTLQNMLAHAGYDPGHVDGAFGRSTLQTVEAYQHAHNLTPDGIVGARTWAMLEASQPATAPAEPAKPDQPSRTEYLADAAMKNAAAIGGAVTAAGGVLSQLPETGQLMLIGAACLIGVCAAGALAWKWAKS